MLLDEPFASLDPALRDSLRTEVVRILRAAGATALLVTHDQAEALSLADRLVVLRNGRVEQLGTPDDSTCARARAGSPSSSARRTSCRAGSRPA